MGKILFYNCFLKIMFLYTLAITETTFSKEFHHFQERHFFKMCFLYIQEQYIFVSRVLYLGSVEFETLSEGISFVYKKTSYLFI